MPEVYVDADACPVKDEVLRVARRHRLLVHIVGNTWLRLGDDPLIHQVVVPPGPDAADDWIAAHAGVGDVVTTADIHLAARCIKAGAGVLDHKGKAFTEKGIGMFVAMRDLMTHLRDTGQITGGGAPFSAKDRSAFLNGLETAIQAALRQA
jgi:uncharacterized protein